MELAVLLVIGIVCLVALDILVVFVVNSKLSDWVPAFRSYKEEAEANVREAGQKQDKLKRDLDSLQYLTSVPDCRQHYQRAVDALQRAEQDLGRIDRQIRDVRFPLLYHAGQNAIEAFLQRQMDVAHLIGAWMWTFWLRDEVKAGPGQQQRVAVKNIEALREVPGILRRQCMALEVDVSKVGSLIQGEAQQGTVTSDWDARLDQLEQEFQEVCPRLALDAPQLAVYVQRWHSLERNYHEFKREVEDLIQQRKAADLRITEVEARIDQQAPTLAGSTRHAYNAPIIAHMRALLKEAQRSRANRQFGQVTSLLSDIDRFLSVIQHLPEVHEAIQRLEKIQLDTLDKAKVQEGLASLRHLVEQAYTVEKVSQAVRWLDGLKRSVDHADLVFQDHQVAVTRSEREATEALERLRAARQAVTQQAVLSREPALQDATRLEADIQARAGRPAAVSEWIPKAREVTQRLNMLHDDVARQLAEARRIVQECRTWRDEAWQRGENWTCLGNHIARIQVSLHDADESLRRMRQVERFDQIPRVIGQLDDLRRGVEREYSRLTDDLQRLNGRIDQLEQLRYRLQRVEGNHRQEAQASIHAIHAEINRARQARNLDDAVSILQHYQHVVEGQLAQWERHL